MKLYRVTFKTRPTKDHPRFFEIQFGYLHIWIYGDGPQDAGERACTIVEQLQYERAEDKESWDESWRASVRLSGGSKLPEFQAAEKTAKVIGIAFFLHELTTGGDESELVAADPP